MRYWVSFALFLVVVAAMATFVALLLYPVAAPAAPFLAALVYTVLAFADALPPGPPERFLALSGRSRGTAPAFVPFERSEPPLREPGERPLPRLSRYDLLHGQHAPDPLPPAPEPPRVFDPAVLESVGLQAVAMEALTLEPLPSRAVPEPEPEFVPGPGEESPAGRGAIRLTDTGLVAGVAGLLMGALALLALVTAIDPGSNEAMANPYPRLIGREPGHAKPEDPQAALFAAANSPAASPSPAVSPSLAATATATPVPPTPTPSPTPTATATPVTPTETPTHTPTPRRTPATRASETGLSGTWEVTDTPSQGSNRKPLQFTITLVEDEHGRISGSGGGLTLEGSRLGTEVQVTFRRSGGSGVFHWSLQRDGTLAGTFVDNGAKNSGTSEARRVI